MKDDKLMEIVMARVVELEATANEQTSTIQRLAAEIGELERDREVAYERRRHFAKCAEILGKERDALKSSLEDVTAQFEALRSVFGMIQISPEKPTRTALRIVTEAVNELNALGYDAVISYNKRSE